MRPALYALLCLASLPYTVNGGIVSRQENRFEEECSGI